MESGSLRTRRSHVPRRRDLNAALVGQLAVGVEHSHELLIRESLSKYWPHDFTMIKVSCEVVA